MACPVLAQEVLAEFMRDGGYDHHMSRLRAALRDQVRAVAAAVARFFPPNCAASLPQGGFMLWIELPRDVDSRQYHAAGIRLTDCLPAVGIPLDPGVPPVTIDLQPMLDTAYDRSRYSELFSYTDPPDPPLTAEQQAWADGILKAKGIIPTA